MVSRACAVSSTTPWTSSSATSLCQKWTGSSSSHQAAKPEFDEIPVIMLTGEEDVDAKVRGLEAGASDYLTKPFHPKELVARVRVHLQNKQLRDRLHEQNEQLELLAHKDSLTGVPNRRYFMECLERELGRTRRHNTSLGLVMGGHRSFQARQRRARPPRGRPGARRHLP